MPSYRCHALLCTRPCEKRKAVASFSGLMTDNCPTIQRRHGEACLKTEQLLSPLIRLSEKRLTKLIQVTIGLPLEKLSRTPNLAPPWPRLKRGGTDFTEHTIYDAFFGYAHLEAVGDPGWPKPVQSTYNCTVRSRRESLPTLTPPSDRRERWEDCED